MTGELEDRKSGRVEGGVGVGNGELGSKVGVVKGGFPGG